MQHLQEQEQGSSISAVHGNARPSPQAKSAKRCNGLCGQTKPQVEFSIKQWRKGKKRQQLCLDCSCLHNVTSPLDKKVLEAIELDECSSSIVLGESSTSDENRPPNFLSPCR
jgi:hypothetical protein